MCKCRCVREAIASIIVFFSLRILPRRPHIFNCQFGRGSFLNRSGWCLGSRWLLCRCGISSWLDVFSIITDLQLGEARIPRSLGMGLASEVLLEFGKLGHAIAVLLQGGEHLVALKRCARIVTSTSNIEVLNRLEELEVCEGGLIATEELISAEVFNDGPHSLDRGVSANLLVIRLESRSKDFINKGAVDYGEHLVGARLFLRG